MSATDTIAEEVRLADLFEPLAHGEISEFLARCSDPFVASVWGTAPTPTTLSRAELPGWYEGLRDLTADTLMSEVVLALSLGLENVVILRHRFSYLGERRGYDTVNHCVLHRGEVAAWFSRPLASEEYAAAWRRRPTGDAARGLSADRSARPSLSPSSL
jgi:hypothetical protein